MKRRFTEKTLNRLLFVRGNSFSSKLSFSIISAMTMEAETITLVVATVVQKQYKQHLRNHQHLHTSFVSTPRHHHQQYHQHYLRSLFIQ